MRAARCGETHPMKSKSPKKSASTKPIIRFDNDYRGGRMMAISVCASMVDHE